MQMRCSAFSTTLLCRTALMTLLLAAQAPAQQTAPLSHHSSGAAAHDRHHQSGLAEAWEGSAKGIAYSESNHHIAGLMVMVMGFAELSHTLRLPSLRWARLLLPAALMLAGMFLMIWSDHEAWPIGSLTFIETFSGGDYEILQHKIYGLLALAVGSIELIRRLRRNGHRAWASPLPLMAIVGGLMLFGHSHGFHPSAQKIAMHHAIMGTMAVTAGSSKLVSTWVESAERPGPKNLEWVWVCLVLLIGAQLLIYSE
jgi:hypothetical protein